MWLVSDGDDVSFNGAGVKDVEVVVVEVVDVDTFEELEASPGFRVILNVCWRVSGAGLLFSEDFENMLAVLFTSSTIVWNDFEIISNSFSVSLSIISN